MLHFAMLSHILVLYDEGEIKFVIWSQILTVGAPTHNELRYVQSQIHITKYINKALITKQPMKNTTHKRTQGSQSIIDSGQNQLKYTYQVQQSDKTHHTKHTPLYTVNLH